MTVDPRAASGFSSAVEAYDRARPAYPDEAITHIAHELGIIGGTTVLDLAAGTGKLTDLLVPIAEHVIAVDPSEPMLAPLQARHRRVETLVGTAEDIPLGVDAVDAVCVGEAFHWFDAARAAVEIDRVLIPGGGLGLLFNRARWDDLPWIEEFRAATMHHRDAAGPWPSGTDQWQQALADSGRFATPRSSSFENLQEIEPDGFVAMVSSWSWIANLEDDTRSEVLADVRGVVGDAPFTLRYETEVFTTISRQD